MDDIAAKVGTDSIYRIPDLFSRNVVLIGERATVSVKASVGATRSQNDGNSSSEENTGYSISKGRTHTVSSVRIPPAIGGGIASASQTATTSATATAAIGGLLYSYGTITESASATGKVVSSGGGGSSGFSLTPQIVAMEIRPYKYNWATCFVEVINS